MGPTNTGVNHDVVYASQMGEDGGIENITNPVWKRQRHHSSNG